MVYYECMERPEQGQRESLLSVQVRKISEKIVDIVCAAITAPSERPEEYSAFKGEIEIELPNNKSATG